MKKNEIAWLRCVIAFSLIFTIFVSSSVVVLAAKDKNILAGEIIVLGNKGDVENPAVKLNGERVFSGQTFFSSGVVSTSETSSATINLGKLGHINLSSNSILSLNFTENKISGKLSAGQIKVFAKEGVLVDIQTIDGTVNNDANQNGVYTIDVQSGKTETSAEQGTVSLNTGETNVPALNGGQQPQSTAKNKFWIPVLVVSAIIGAAVIIILVNRDEDVVSPVR